MQRQLWLIAILILAAAGCTSTRDETTRDQMADVGTYPPPPAGFQRVRVGIAPQFKDGTGKNVGAIAPAQLETLVIRANRFSVIDRTSLEALLQEQGLQGVVTPAELAQKGKIRGVDYLWTGEVTNFRVKQVKSGTNFGLGQITPTLGAVGVDTSKQTIETEVGVDIKLVDCQSGEIIAKDFGEVIRTESASGLGIRILGVGGSGNSEIDIDEDSKGKLLRRAIDEVLRKTIPVIDNYFSNPAYQPPVRDAAAAGTAPAAAGAMTANEPAGDYMPDHVHLVGQPGVTPDWWRPCVMTTQPTGGKQEAQFTDARNGESFWSGRFRQTRPAAAADLKVGANVFALVTNHTFEPRTAGGAGKNWKDAGYNWAPTQVIDVSGVANGIVSVAVQGKMTDVHLSNLRVAR